MARPKSALSHFIESLPTDLSAKEVVKRAAAAGMVTSDANVHRVRDRARKAAKGGAAAKKAAPKKVAPKKAAPKKAAPKKAAPKKAAPKKAAPKKAAKVAAKAAPVAAKRAEAALRDAVLELGLTRAEALIAGMRSQVSKLIAGF